MITRLALCVVALASASCATLEREQVAAPANGGKVAMRVGTPLVVSLPPDPSTGYGWVLRSATPNLQLVGGPDYTPLPKPPGLVGVPDTTAFRFRATETGSGALEFAWSVPPGAAPQPDRVVRYEVAIGPGMTLATDYFGSWGAQSARTPGSAAVPAQVPTSPFTPGTVKYWTL
jgi:inhibitor of cysteine peptidase